TMQLMKRCCSSRASCKDRTPPTILKPSAARPTSTTRSSTRSRRCTGRSRSGAWNKRRSRAASRLRTAPPPRQVESRAVENQRATTPRAADLELLAELERPDLFQRLVDSLPLGPIRASLRLWGVVHGVYRLSDERQREITHE